MVHATTYQVTVAALITWNFCKGCGSLLLTLLLISCGQKTHRAGLGLGGLVHKEAHLCFSNFTKTSLKSTDAGSINCPLIQLIPSIDYSIREKLLTAVPCTPKFNFKLCILDT